MFVQRLGELVERLINNSGSLGGDDQMRSKVSDTLFDLCLLTRSSSVAPDHPNQSLESSVKYLIKLLLLGNLASSAFLSIASKANKKVGNNKVNQTSGYAIGKRRDKALTYSYSYNVKCPSS